MTRAASISVAPDALDAMLPMHVIAAEDGTILHTGRTLAKIHPDQSLVGQNFFSVFEPRRPRVPGEGADINALAATKFYLRLRDPDRTPLIGTAISLERGKGVLVNLSFGIAVVEAVGRFALAGSDFAATDLTLEMLYLVEAKSAAMAESRKLNERLHGAKAVAEAEAMSDTLTGLRNRRALDQTLQRLISRREAFTLMHLDLDYFKQVNDTLGHAAGDLVLTEVARILLEETRQVDVVARAGGDEFVVVFAGITDRKRISTIATRLIERLEKPVPYGAAAARISASIGIVTSTAYDLPDATRMMRDADMALYASKNRGRARFTYFAPEPGGEGQDSATSAAEIPPEARSSQPSAHKR